MPTALDTALNDNFIYPFTIFHWIPLLSSVDELFSKSETTVKVASHTAAATNLASGQLPFAKFDVISVLYFSQ